MAPSGLRSPDETPRPAGGPAGAPPGPATLAGSTPGGPEDTGAPEAGDQGTSLLRQAVQQLRQSEMGFLELAKQFPAAAEPLRQAGTAVRAALRQIIANPGQPGPPAPNIGG